MCYTCEIAENPYQIGLDIKATRKAFENKKASNYLQSKTNNHHSLTSKYYKVKITIGVY